MLLKNKVQQALYVIREKLGDCPKTAVILGSGLGNFAESLLGSAILSTTDIPYYARSTVPGQLGRWVKGFVSDVPVLAIQGRIHFYEGYTAQQVTYPIDLLGSWGVRNLIVTSASGGLDPDFHSGDLMLITDHIAFGMANPLHDQPENLLGPRFPHLFNVYDIKMQKIAEKFAKAQGIKLQKGVFCYVTGPSYETAAEVRMLQFFGARAVSMSTVPEVIVARQRHLTVLGISLITNLCTGLALAPLAHEDVTAAANQAGAKFGRLLMETILKISELN
jgi:purine-nucleoside phosphorylase